MVIKIPDKQTITLICFYSDDYETNNLKNQFEHINDNIHFYNELESCINFIQSIEKQNIFLIIPSNSPILSHINNLHQINSIFIFGLKTFEK